jgi:hypothetical protein
MLTPRLRQVARLLSALGLAACLLGLAAPAEAQTSGGPFGLGIILGEPTGLTGKVWFDRTEHALQFHLAWDFTDEGFAIFLDYLFHLYPWRSPGSGFELPLYVGIGGKLVFNTHRHYYSRWRDHHHGDVGFGIRVPVGLAMLFKRAPVEIFLEIAVGVRLIPETRGDIDGGIGVRYYF